jgi:Dolichyl-phosphate-mannose-protein mannosyltransferase
MRSRWLAASLPAALLLLFAWRGVLAMRADGATADEAWHLGYGERALSEGTFLRTRELNSKMPVSALNAMPVVVARHWRPGMAWPATLFVARLPSLLLGVLLGWLIWLWARALFGRWSGILALFLYSFCPNVLAHAHLVTTDISTALAMFAAVFFLWRYRQRPGRARLWAAAAVFGVAQLTKATALLLAPLFGAILVVGALRQVMRQEGAAAGDGSAGGGAAEDGAADGGAAEGGAVDGGAAEGGVAEGGAVDGGRTGRRGAGGPRLGERVRWLGAELWRSAPLAAACAVAAVVALNLGFAGEGTFTPLRRYAFISDSFRSLARVPVVRDLPLPLPYAYLQGLDMVAYDSRAPGWSYLHGQYSQHGFAAYFLLALLVKVPLGTQLLAALALWLCLAGRARAPGGEEYLAVPVLLLLAYFTLAFKLDIGVRYVLPVLPFLFVFSSRVVAGPRRPAGAPDGAGAAAPSAEGVEALRRAPAPRWLAPAAGALALWVAVASWSVHPHYLVYFNELAGGPDNGWRWLIDSNQDWGQDGDRVRQVYVPSSPVHVFVEPSGPLVGRIAVGVSNLVGRDPAAAARMAWLRDNFKPIAVIGGSWKVFDVHEDDLARCCAGLPRVQVIDDLASDLAPGGRVVAGGDGVNVRYLAQLNDGLVGVGAPLDAVRTAPVQPHPVRAWFGVVWPGDRIVARVVAFPGFSIRKPERRRFLALDYVFQLWDGTAWHDLPGTRQHDNQQLRVEHRFAPRAMRGIRLVIERERNDQGTLEPGGGYRAACLELAAYPQ